MLPENFQQKSKSKSLFCEILFEMFDVLGQKSPVDGNPSNMINLSPEVNRERTEVGIPSLNLKKFTPSTFYLVVILSIVLVHVIINGTFSNSRTKI